MKYYTRSAFLDYSTRGRYKRQSLLYELHTVCETDKIFDLICIYPFIPSSIVHVLLSSS